MFLKWHNYIILHNFMCEIFVIILKNIPYLHDFKRFLVLYS